jgi:hypothetical protein
MKTRPKLKYILDKALAHEPLRRQEVAQARPS